MTLLTSEVALIDKARDAIDRTRRPFTCRGLVVDKEDVDFGSLGVYISTVKEDKSRETTYYPFPITDSDASEIYSKATVSPFGHGDQTIVDVTYRSAREVKAGTYVVNGDVLSAGSILPTLQSRLETTHCLSAKMHKLSVYAKGDFFKPHRDTPRSENHLGTIVVCLPSLFSGGQLVVRQDGEEDMFEWSTMRSNDPPLSSIRWAFLFSDCEHEVLPVTDGFRVTIQFDVFLTESPIYVGNVLLEDEAIFKALQAFNEHCPRAGTYGFALHHTYPTADGRLPFSMLKGLDMILYNAIKALNWSVEVNTIYEAPYGDDDSDFDENAGEEDEGSTTDAANVVNVEVDAKYRMNHWISTRTQTCYGQGGEGYEITDILMDGGAKIRKDVAWITLPSHFENSETYMTYGNEAQAENQYKTFALLVRISAAQGA